MTKYYFISYTYQNNWSAICYENCLCKVENQTLVEIIAEIAKNADCQKESVVITSIKDLSKEEYIMLTGDKNE